MSEPIAPTRVKEIDRATLRFWSVPFMTIVTSVLAQIAIPTDPLGVPISLQSLAVVLCALMLGPKLGIASMLLYLAVGALGVGVFAEGEAGALTLIGQTGGYLVGFVLAQPVAHLIVRRKDGSVRGWVAVFVAGLAVHMVIFTFGVPGLYIVRLVDSEADALSMWDAFYYGFVVFIPGMLLKSGIAAWIGAYTLGAVREKLW